MTREEAIRHLGTYSSTMGSGLTTQEQHEEAKKMAIEALERGPYFTISFNEDKLRELCQRAAEELKEQLNGVELAKKISDDLAVDCIDRQATLDAIIKRLGIKNETYLLEAERVLYQQILAMPSVTPQEPKKGHWIRVDKDKLRCSECDVIHFIAQYPQGKIVWCPNCGAKMESEEVCESEAADDREQ